MSKFRQEGLFDLQEFYDLEISTLFVLFHLQFHPQGVPFCENRSFSCQCDTNESRPHIVFSYFLGKETFTVFFSNRIDYSLIAGCLQNSETFLKYRER